MNGAAKNTPYDPTQHVKYADYVSHMKGLILQTLLNKNGITEPTTNVRSTENARSAQTRYTR